MRIAIVYATREGQTRHIAEYLAGALMVRGLEAELFDAAKADPDLTGCGAVIVAGSIHLGRHERELVRFVKRHRAELEALPSALISVSMSQASLELPSRTPEERERARKDVQGTIDLFTRQTGWHPRWVHPTAGALFYTKYNPLVRFVMRAIAVREGGSGDTKHDHEYTDWTGLERFADQLAGAVASAAPAQ